MSDAKPLTKERREKLIERVRQVGVGTQDDRTILAYEATVKDRDERIAALETELAASRIDAIGSDDLASYEHGAAIEAEERVAALEAEVAALRAAKGEK